MKVKTLYVRDGKSVHIENYPSFSVTGSVSGMKKMFYGKDALLVRCGSYIYNVTSSPEIYYSLAH